MLRHRWIQPPCKCQGPAGAQKEPTWGGPYGPELLSWGLSSPAQGQDEDPGVSVTGWCALAYSRSLLPRTFSFARFRLLQTSALFLNEFLPSLIFFSSFFSPSPECSCLLSSNSFTHPFTLLLPLFFSHLVHFVCVCGGGSQATLWAFCFL